MEKILVTGTSGFVGERFCKKSNKRGIRKVSLQKVTVDEIDFSDVKSVLHLAGIAHRMERTPESLYFNVNYELTRDLAIRAKRCGVSHFIFMSTIKIYGDDYEFLNLDTIPKPNDPYGESKLMAEKALMELSCDSFKVAIIRPPMIYGPNVKGNMKRLVGLVSQRKYIPLGGINNQRSVVAIDNLVDLINKILDLSATGIFLIQDDKAVSTSDILNNIAHATGSKIRLISIPGPLRKLLRLFKPDIYKRVFGSLVVDDSFTKQALDFLPVLTTAEGINLMINESTNE